MKKLMMGVVAAAFFATPAMAQSGSTITGGAWDCSIKMVTNVLGQWTTNEDSYECAKATVNAMNWLSGAMTSSTDNFNLIVDNFDTVDHAGGGGVGITQRDQMIAEHNKQKAINTSLVTANQALRDELDEADAATAAAQTAASEATELMCNYIKELRRITEQSTDIMLWNVGNGKESTCSGVGVDINGGDTYYVNVVDADGNPL